MFIHVEERPAYSALAAFFAAGFLAQAFLAAGFFAVFVVAIFFLPYGYVVN